MKRMAIAVIGSLAFATAAFAATTSPPVAEKRYSMPVHTLNLSQGEEQKSFRDLLPAKASDLKTKPLGSMPVVKKQGDDGLGVPVMRVDSVGSTVYQMVARETWDDIIGLKKKAGINGDSKTGMFYVKGNNGARAASAAMDKFDMSAVHLGDNNYIVGKTGGDAFRASPS